ncbi:hypothetical protein JCM33374_g3679 [Metschnikowia sp. JCM 33374]|nr:hypothetical protein JCM33374_g3679 [Metschnikowia sp. JCM 33374]
MYLFNQVFESPQFQHGIQPILLAISPGQEPHGYPEACLDLMTFADLSKNFDAGLDIFQTEGLDGFAGPDFERLLESIECAERRLLEDAIESKPKPKPMLKLRLIPKPEVQPKLMLRFRQKPKLMLRFRQKPKLMLRFRQKPKLMLRFRQKPKPKPKLMLKLKPKRECW